MVVVVMMMVVVVVCHAEYYVIPGCGRKPANPESITTHASVMLRLCHNELLAVMDSGSRSRSAGMTG